MDGRDLAAACAGAGCAVTPGELRGGDADQELEKRMDLLKTLVTSACCTAPLMLEMHPKLQFLAGTALQFGPGRYFYKSAWRGLRNRTFGMDFLVSLSSTLIYLYSAYVTFTPRRSYKLYFASDGVLLSLILFGKYMEQVAAGEANYAIRPLMHLQPRTAMVQRGDTFVELPVDQIAEHDRVRIRPGEHVPVDGTIISGQCAVDESMLTGESRTVRHKVGEQVYSGAPAVSGMALVKVNAVGSHSYAATLTAQAKVYKKTVSDLNKGINTILKFMTFLVVPLCILLILSQIHTVGGWGTALSTGEWRQAVVSAVAGVVGMIPEGLVLLTSLNFAVAAMRLARHNTLVQELESVETLARVDALNLDKTGTITDGGIAFNRLVMLDSANAAAEQAATQALYDCCNEEQPNGTGQAVLAGLKAQGYGAGAVESRVPFSSARKWSAVRKSGETWYMGAPEVIISALEGDYSSVLQQVNEYANDGNRVLLVARSTAPLSEGSCRQKRLRGAVEGANVSDGRQLDVQAEPVALVLCSEKIREDAERTLAWFREQGVRCRVISGDNPVTVGAIARRVKLTGDHEPVAMDARVLP